MTWIPRQQPIFLVLFFWCGLAPAVIAQHSEPDTPTPPKKNLPKAAKPAQATADIPSRYPIGEKLVYDGLVKKAGLSVNVGTVSFSVTRDKIGSTVLTACAQGEKFGYTLATKVAAVQSLDERFPVHYSFEQYGSENRRKKLKFTANSAQYLRWKHCSKNPCTNKNHIIQQRKWKGGVIPWGKESVHCRDRHCGHESHRHWGLRRAHDLDYPHFDMLSAIYHARSLDLKPGGQPIVIQVLNDHDRWVVTAKAREGGLVKVPAGTFSTMLLTLDPTPAPGTKPKKKFSGLFGINGKIKIWLDKKTRRPILVKGKLPFGFTNFEIRVILTEISTTHTPCELVLDKPTTDSDEDEFDH